MSQQIQASTPSPVSPATAPVISDQGSTTVSPQQWVVQGATPAVASATTAQPQYQATQASDPSSNSQYSQSTYSSSPTNPWEAAMGSLERVLTSQVSSPSQAAPYLTQAPQLDTTQLSQPSQVQPSAYLQQDQQILPTSASPTQTSSQASTAPSLSEASAEVVRNFGIEAPGILNAYACSLEDLLMEQAQKTDDVIQVAQGMEQILTDPDHLADYTDRFFTEVVPVELTPEDFYEEDYEYTDQAVEAYQQQYDMPAPPVGAAGQPGVPAGQSWEQFGEVMQRSPENAWRVLSSMQPEALRSKLLFMEPS